MAAGSQLYLFDNRITKLDIRGSIAFDAHNYPLDSIFDVCQRMNGPLPVYHPQFLQQAILAGICCLYAIVHSALGKLQLVKMLLGKLEILLVHKLNNRNDGSQIEDTSKINTFLDTPLSDFIIEQVLPRTGQV